MKPSQHWIILLSSPLLILLTGRVSFAFSFTLPSQTPEPICTSPNSPYCLSTSHTKPGVGIVTVSTTSVSELPLGGTDDFFNLLTSSVWAQNGWTFNKAQPVDSLTGRFDIGVYAPFIFLTNQETVGAEIQALYNPVVGQDPVGSNVHFIQRVVNNHAYTVTLQGVIKQPPGTPEDKIDTVIEQTQPGFSDPQNPQKPTFNPFYDTYGQVRRNPNQTILFVDTPSRDDIYYNDKNWDAELYLAEVKDPINNPNQVTIYNGISWGWTSKFTPCVPSSGGGGCVTSAPSPSPTSVNSLRRNPFQSSSDSLVRISSDLLQDPQLSYVDDTLTAKTQNVSSQNTDDDALPAEAVPEPTTALGTLFALAILPVITRLKNRKNKEK